MINFSTLKALTIPEGVVVKIECDGKVLWNCNKHKYINYVSLGDSIAAGHTIDADWEKNYGYSSQYGENGNSSTVVVANSYTDLIRKDLVNTYGQNSITTSFAHSGDTVADLMNKLSHTSVREAIANASVVTICIGANDVLQPALSNLDEYINTGDLNALASTVESNLQTLNNNNASTSYFALFNKLTEINPEAKYIFTTVYNPYKYLWIEEGQNGFFSTLLSTIPQMNFDIDEMIENTFGIDDLGYPDPTNWFQWKSIELELDLDGIIKEGILSTYPFQLVFNRVNGLSSWAEKYVEGTLNFDGLNRVLRNKISEYKNINPNFFVAETKALFDTYPDRPISADVHYNDLVNVEYTRGYNLSTMDWGALWDGKDVASFWGDLAWKHLHFASYDRILELIASFSFNVWDYVSFDMEGFASELVNLIIERVIMPDVDPHPEVYGHKVLKDSFYNVSEVWESLQN